MPIFEYVCGECSHAFEAIVQGAQQARCPACDSVQLEKQLSVFAVSTAGSDSYRSADLAPCGQCGDPRGPGACGLN